MRAQFAVDGAVGAFVEQVQIVVAQERACDIFQELATMPTSHRTDYLATVSAEPINW
jgi:hypothetical protein